MGKDGYSRKGFFGQTIHYDSHGKKLGESRPNFWGGVDHYDANDHKTGHSHQGFFGQTNHYDSRGNKIGESRPNFLGGSNYHGTGSSHGYFQSVDDYDTIQSILEDEALILQMLLLGWKTTAMIPTTSIFNSGRYHGSRIFLA